MEKTRSIIVTESQFNLLIMGLRYLELHHPTEEVCGKPKEYRTDFRKLLNKIIDSLQEIQLFEPSIEMRRPMPSNGLSTPQ